MKIILAGAGLTGNFIAKYLAQDGYDITVIDNDPNTIKEITDNQSIAGIIGECTSIEILKEAGIKAADMFIVVSPDDEINILACYLANIYGVQIKVARITNPIYMQEEWQEFLRLKKIPIDNIISPGSEIIKFMSQRIDYSYLNIIDIFDTSDGQVKLFSVMCKEDCLVLNRNVNTIQGEARSNLLFFRISGILREDIFFIPTPEEAIRLGDKIFITTLEDSIEDSYLLFYALNETENKFLESQSPNIIIYGDHPFIKKLALELTQYYKKIKVVIPQANEETETMALELEKNHIQLIIDDITNENYRNNYIKSNEDIIIIINKSDEDNILTTLMLKYQSVGNLFCYLSTNHYENFLLSNGISHILIPNYFIMSSILTNLRRGIVFNVFSFYNKAELIEIEIASSSAAVGRRLGDVEIPGGMIITSLLNEAGKSIFLDEDTLIPANSRITYMILRKHIRDIENIFSQTLELDTII
ncbi:Trk system potassium transporter TrkA [Candidatus Hepatincolaceae symbiont of Richtersius coronifer]